MTMLWKRTRSRLYLNKNRKKNKRNIACDFNTNDKPITINRQLEFDEVEGDDDRIQNPFISPHRTTIPIELIRKPDYPTSQFDANLSSENEEESEERFTFRKSHEFDERNSFPDAFDSIGYASKKKNTPLKSINTKTKESLTHFNKLITPNKSFEKFKFGSNDVYREEGYPLDTRMYKYGPGKTDKSTILTRGDYSILSKRIKRPEKQSSPAIAI